MRLDALTPAQTNVLKGVGILVIVLHNFLHNVPPLIGENQFQFEAETFDRFMATMASSVTEWPRAIATFLGHYGVSVFVFLSAYGLTRRYADERSSYGIFLWHRVTKVYVTFVSCILVYLLLWGLRALATGTDEPVEWRALALKLTLVSNLVPHQAMTPVGPWWFMAFIFQFYAIYPLLMRACDRWGGYGLGAIAVLCVVAEGLWNETLRGVGVNLNHGPVGHMAVIALGIAAARLSTLRLSRPTLALIVVAFLVGQAWRWPWLVADLWAAILLVVLPVVVARLVPVPRPLTLVFAFFGGISMPLFLVNGFLRGPFHDLALSRPSWWFTLVCAGLSLAFSTLVAVGLDAFDRRLRCVGRHAGGLVFDRLEARQEESSRAR